MLVEHKNMLNEAQTVLNELDHILHTQDLNESSVHARFTELLERNAQLVETLEESTDPEVKEALNEQYNG